jgi:hypothetical protein
MIHKPTLSIGDENQAMSLKDRLMAAKNHAISLKLTREHGWKADMARAAGCSPQNITNATRDVKPQEWMSADALKRIATWAQLNETWMVFGTGTMHILRNAKDDVYAPHVLIASEDVKSPRTWGTPSTSTLSAVTSTGLAPRISRAGRKGEVLYRANSEWPEADRRPYFTSKQHSEYCKFILVNDEEMNPHLKKGDWVLIDPNGQPERGKTCLFLLPDDSYVIRFYELIASGSYEARDAQGRTLTRERHGITFAGRYVLMQREDE